MKISIEHYIATNNPNEVAEILIKRGMPSPRSLPDAIQKLKFIMSKEGGAIVKELADIDTPYQNLIMSSLGDSKSETKSNACGCSGFDGEIKSNCSGDGSCSCAAKKSSVDGDTKSTDQPAASSNTTPEAPKDVLTKYAPHIAIGLLLIVTTAVLIKK